MRSRATFSNNLGWPLAGIDPARAAAYETAPEPSKTANQASPAALCGDHCARVQESQPPFRPRLEAGTSLESP